MTVSQATSRSQTGTAINRSDPTARLDADGTSMSIRSGGTPAEQDSDARADEVASSTSRFQLPASWSASRASLAEVAACMVDAVSTAEFAALVILATERPSRRAPHSLLDGAGIVGTSPTAAAMFEVESQLDEGPIVTACRSESIVIAGSVSADRGWRRFGPAMAGCQLQSVLCAPVPSSTGVVAGALAVYSRQKNAFDASAIVLAAALADVVTNTLSSAQTLETTTRAFAAFREAHQRTRIVDQAVGVLISRHNCTEDQARSRLSRMSSQGHQELATSAHMIVDDARREAHLAFIARDLKKRNTSIL